MTYIFFLGSHPSLSVAEILAYFQRHNNKITSSRLLNSEIFEIIVTKKLEVRQLIKELGGTIKIGELVAKLTGDVESGAHLIIKELISLPVERLHFGFSAYGVRINKKLGLDIKRELVSLGKMARWVVGREDFLSSVIIEQNKLLTHGYDFSFIKKEKNIYMVKTLAVQPFKELSKRDYGRPGRDDQSGMLPPKLAQIMLNIGLVDSKKNLLDPFCGSGTVLSEAVLLGVGNIFGSDISSKAINDTKVNLAWIDKDGLVKGSDQRIAQVSATELSEYYKNDSIDVIVTEPFLGPQRGNYDVREVVLELEKMYSLAIQEFAKVLKTGGRVVMIWPVFKTKNDRIFMSIRIADKLKMINPLSGKILNEVKLTNRNTLLYGRPDQRVWREIVVLEK